MNKIKKIFLFLFFILVLYLTSHQNYDKLMLKNNILKRIPILLNPFTFINYNINFYKSFKKGNIKNAKYQMITVY